MTFDKIQDGGPAEVRAPRVLSSLENWHFIEVRREQGHVYICPTLAMYTPLVSLPQHNDFTTLTEIRGFINKPLHRAMD